MQIDTPLYDLVLTKEDGFQVQFTQESGGAMDVKFVDQANTAPIQVTIVVEDTSKPQFEINMVDTGGAIPLAVSLGATGPTGASGADGTSLGFINFASPITQTLLPGVATLLDVTQLAPTQIRNDGFDPNHVFFSGNKFWPIGSQVGEKYRLRITFTVTSIVISNAISCDVNIGVPGNPIIIASSSQPLVQDAGSPESVTFNLDVWAGSTFAQNGAEFILRTRTECDISDLNVLVTIEHL